MRKQWFETELGKALFDNMPPRAEAATPQRRAVRQYAAAKSSRLTEGWGSTKTSEDAELASSLQMLRSRCRALVRDAAFAKRAKTIIVNNVVGPGIGLQALVGNSRGAMNSRVNDSIESTVRTWQSAENCHTGGTLHFADLERLALGEVFTTGEVFIRWYPRPFGPAGIPFALEVIEAERIAEEVEQIIERSRDTVVKLGVEVNNFGRAVRYFVRSVHPGDIRFQSTQRDEVVPVPAEFIFHIRMIDRWPQTRAAPWLHAVARKLKDLDGYSEAEIIAARASANIMAFIEADESLADMNDETGESEINLEPGSIERLLPGEKVHDFNPSRPNANADPFIRMMLREIAAGSNVSFESLSRDYSQSNYSSSRLALLDDRDCFRALQQWWIRSFRLPLHKLFIRQAALAGAIPGVGRDQYFANPEAFEAVRFKPRGWSWIDPTKEVEAAVEQVKAGFTTVRKVIEQTADGDDFEDILQSRVEELAKMEEAGIVFTTSPENYLKPEPVAPAPTGKDPESDPEKPDAEDPEDTPSARVVPIGRR